MNTYRILYKTSTGKRGMMIRSPDFLTAEHEFHSVYPNRQIIKITPFRSPLSLINMVSYIYSLEVYKRGTWRPVFYPPQSSNPVESSHLPYVEERAEFISSKFTGDKFRIVKTEKYLIMSYEH